MKLSVTVNDDRYLCKLKYNFRNAKLKKNHNGAINSSSSNENNFLLLFLILLFNT